MLCWLKERKKKTTKGHLGEWYISALEIGEAQESDDHTRDRDILLPCQGLLQKPLPSSGVSLPAVSPPTAHSSSMKLPSPSCSCSLIMLSCPLQITNTHFTKSVPGPEGVEIHAQKCLLQGVKSVPASPHILPSLTRGTETTSANALLGALDV